MAYFWVLKIGVRMLDVWVNCDLDDNVDSGGIIERSTSSWNFCPKKTDH
ncbi:hypothetical protein FVER14953_20327 [Fusarium verticillioides]|nr:hypothetical protein FVER14953_20327 [Fusarium verticillioides]